MKKSITGALTLLAGACAVHAQGTVSFANYANGTGSYVYVSYKATGVALGGSATGPVATLQNYAAEVGNGNDWSVQLYGGATAAALTPMAGLTATLANGGLDPAAGTWYSAANGAPAAGLYNGQTAYVQVYAWYNAGGTITSYAQALLDGVPTGTSAVAPVVLGGPASSGPGGVAAALPAAGLGNFTVTTATPEPSSIALGVMGASAFLMRLRRKQ